MKPYELPALDYDYSALEPHYSARMREVYWGCFRRAAQALAEPVPGPGGQHSAGPLAETERVSGPEVVELPSSLDEPIHGVGRGFMAYPQLEAKLGLGTVHKRVGEIGDEVGVLRAGGFGMAQRIDAVVIAPAEERADAEAGMRIRRHEHLVAERTHHALAEILVLDLEVTQTFRTGCGDHEEHLREQELAKPSTQTINHEMSEPSSPAATHSFNPSRGLSTISSVKR